MTVVLYHHVTDHPSHLTDFLNVATPVEAFRSHLARFKQDYQVVGLDEILSGEIPERALLITFDDAYRSVLTAAAPMLREYGFPSVFFINSGLVGNHVVMLDNLLCLLSHTVEIPVIEEVMIGCRKGAGNLSELIGKTAANLSYQERLEARSRLVNGFGIDESHVLMQTDLYLHQEDLGLLRDYGVEVGNHTRNHVHCRTLSPEEADAEIRAGKQELEGWAETEVRAFSYPYGNPQDATPVAREAIKKSHHRISFLVCARTNKTLDGDNPLYRVSLQDQEVSKLNYYLEVLPRIRSLADKIKGKPGSEI